MPKHGLTTTSNSNKTARATVARWNDKVKRHTLYTVCGTSQDGWGLMTRPTDSNGLNALLALARTLTGNNSLQLSDLPSTGEYTPVWASSFDTATARLVNSNLYNWVPISYPAGGPGVNGGLENNWQPTGLSMAASVKMGVDELTRQIKATPGTFALIGMSQGSAVISQVLKSLLPGGALASRYKDCIAGVAFGNPCRAIGASFPGGTPAFGGGVLTFPNPAEPITGGLNGVKTPNWWWEMSLTGDFFSSAPMHTAAGPILTPAVQALFRFPGGMALDANSLVVILGLLTGAGASLPLLLASLVRTGFFNASTISSFMGGGEAKGLLSMLAQKQKQSASAILSQWIYDQIGALNLGASLASGTPVITPSNTYPNANPHIRYGLDKPPTLPVWPGLTGLNGNSTFVDVAVAYLNRRAVEVAPR